MFKFVLKLAVCLLIGFSTASDLPNILIIVADDLGYNDLGVFGSVTIETPNLDKLAYDGMKLTQFYSTAPLCSSSRAALLTGRFPQRTGVYTNSTYPRDLRYRVFYPSSLGALPKTELTIANFLKTKGYHSKLVGKWHLGHYEAKNYTQMKYIANEYENININNNIENNNNDINFDFNDIRSNDLFNQFTALPTDRGFDSFFGLPYSHEEGFPGPAPEGWVWPPVPLMRDHSIVEQPANLSTLTNLYTAEVIDFLYNQSANDSIHGTHRPWFIYYGFEQPHIPLFRSEQFKNVSRRGRYGDTVQEIDYNIGLIIDALQKTGFDDNTLILFTSDNGAWLHPNAGTTFHDESTYPFDGGSNAPFRGGKGSTWEGGVHVPAILYWKNKIPSNSVCQSPIYNMDILPTILDYLNMTLPNDRTYDGTSILDNILNKNNCPTDHSKDPHSFIYYWRESMLYAVRYESYKAHYITRKGFGPYPPIKHDPPLLYNVEWDPSESIPLNTSEAQYAQILKIIDNAKIKNENDVYSDIGYPMYDPQSWLVVPCCDKDFNETEAKEFAQIGQYGLALWDMCVCNWKPWSKITWNR